MADARIKVMYFKVRLAVSFLEGERTKLTLSIVQLAEKDPNPRRNDLVALRHAREHGWARLGLRPPRYAQQFLFGHGSRTPPRELRQQCQLQVGFRVCLGGFQPLS